MSNSAGRIGFEQGVYKRQVFGHGFLLTKGEKMSKSKGNALKPADLVGVFGVDAYRYYFMSDVQFGHDGSISMERMVQVYNNELANTWGNLVSRVFNMNKKYFEALVPTVDAEATAAFDNPLKEEAAGLYETYDQALEQVDFTQAAAAVQALAARANRYIEETEPFKLAKDPEKADELAFVMYNLLETIRIIALYMACLLYTSNNPAVQLIRDGEGRVTGLIAKDDQGYYQINANNGVILATGGYDANPDMMKAWCRPEDIANSASWCPTLGTTGDGHLMGLAVGAQMDPVPHAVMNFCLLYTSRCV